MFYLKLQFMLVGITVLWVLPVASIAFIKSFRSSAPRALRFIQSTDGAWYWPVLWLIALSAVIITSLTILPLSGIMFAGTDFGAWLLKFKGEAFDANASVIVYNFIELNREAANFWFYSIFFVGILGIKVGLLGTILSWRLWHSEDVAGGN